MGTVLSNFHGQSARKRDHSDGFFEVGMIEPIDTRSRIRNAKGGRYWATICALESSATRAREASSFAMHSTWLFLFSSCLQDESLCDNSTSTRMYCKNASARVKIEKSFGDVKLLRVFGRFWLSLFSSISELYYWRLLSILIRSPRCWKIYCIQKSLGYERARPAYVAFSFPLLWFVTLLSHLSTENREVTRRRD